jgi:hypothetical protein
VILVGEAKPASWNKRMPSNGNLDDPRLGKTLILRQEGPLGMK